MNPRTLLSKRNVHNVLHQISLTKYVLWVKIKKLVNDLYIFPTLYIPPPHVKLKLRTQKAWKIAKRNWLLKLQYSACFRRSSDCFRKRNTSTIKLFDFEQFWNVYKSRKLFKKMTTMSTCVIKRRRKNCKIAKKLHRPENLY